MLIVTKNVCMYIYVRVCKCSDSEGEQVNVQNIKNLQLQIY